MSRHHKMSHVDWIIGVCVVVGAIALACIGDYPDALRFW